MGWYSWYATVGMENPDNYMVKSNHEMFKVL
jgi:hypothetical protein